VRGVSTDELSQPASPASARAAGAVDVHAHIFPAGVPDLAGETGDERWPSLEAGDAGSGEGRIMCGPRVFRVVRPSLWDLQARIAELDAAGIAAQLVSPVPVTMTYWADADLAALYQRQLNDAIAREVSASGGRLAGLGGVPLQDPGRAVAELERAVGQLGLRGVQIGSLIGDMDLADPRLDPFFAVAAARGAIVFVHPTDGGGGTIRRTGQPFDFGLGMPTDTAIAATALVFEGVLARHPRLRVLLAHGCGTFPIAFPRLAMGALLTGHIDQAGFAALPDAVRRLWVDALVFDPANLALLIERFGAEHVLLGTDDPFVPGQLREAQEMVRKAAGRGLISESQAEAILGANARALLDLSGRAED
jgi:aminocarboxymuconate-semialdehyde decarboxylase